MKLTHFTLTDVGKQRTNNEDSVLVNAGLGLYLLADGMGGHAAGEVASKVALRSVESFFERNRNISIDQIARIRTFPDDMSLAARKLLCSIMEANTEIEKTVAKNPELRGMGTTIVALHADGEDILLGHVGDSRIYRIRRGRLRRISEDHSLFERELKKNYFAKGAIENLPHKDSLTRALGHMPKATVDLNYATPRAGDVFLLCSDGLSDMVPEEYIQDIVADNLEDLKKTGETLLKAALDAGGVDNVSLILVKVLEG